MKRFLKGVFITVGLIIIVVAAAAYVSFALPRPEIAPDLQIEITAQRVERGKYLANGVAACITCHSKRDFSYFSGPVDSSTFGAGGEGFTREMGFPFDLYSKNITPAALGNWSDGEIFRAITHGISKDGSAIFPLMPFEKYAKMNREDLYSIIAYLRTLPPIKNEIPERDLDFPLNILVNTFPSKAEVNLQTDTTSNIEYGKYLITIGSCVQCHSKEDKGDIIPGTEYGGGSEFHESAGTVYSANISSDKETGIGNWSRERFIQRFKQYSDTGYNKTKVSKSDFNTPMPWVGFSSISEKDLGFMYDYLQTVKPIKNRVEKFKK